MSDVEHALACAENGLLVVRRDLATLEVTGKDRQSWLNGLVTQDLAPRKSGDATLGLVVAKNGKIEAEVAIVLGENELLVGLAVELSSSIREKLDRHLIMEDAAVEPSKASLEWAFGFGPAVEEGLSVARELGAAGGFTHRGGVPLLIVAAPALGPVLEAISARLGSSFAMASSDAWLRFRVERGIAERGADFVEGETYPQEAALESDEVSFAKGCYLGQEAVFMLEKRGHVSKRLVQIVLPSLVEVGAEVRDPEGAAIGKITSVAPRKEGAVALGVLKYKHARAAHEVRIDSRQAGPPIVAQVTSLLAIPSNA